MTVLIVDDSVENIQVIMESLNSIGCKFLYAKNGVEGIQRVKYHHPDLILLDIMMPQMDGFEVCTILKQDEQTKNIPIIFLSAIDENRDVLKGFDLGAVDYVSKPFRSSELIARIKTHLKLYKYEQKLEQKINNKVEKIGKLKDKDRKKELILT